MPADYYTNMLSLRADILVVTNLLVIRDKRLMEHFERISMDVSLLMVESFLTLFTGTCHSSIVDVIVDHFVIDGSNVLIKAMVLLISYMRVKLLEINNFGKMVMFCKNELKRYDLVDPIDFSKDMMNMYLNRYLIGELRDYYTNREKEAFKTAQNETKTTCKLEWPICYKSLDQIKANVDIERQMTFRSQFVMDNFRFDYFSKKVVSATKAARKHVEASLDANQTIFPLIQEDSLLIERQRHICDCNNHEFEEMKREVKALIKSQVFNSNSLKNAQDELNLRGSPKVSDIVQRHKGNIYAETGDDASSYSETPGSRKETELSEANKIIFGTFSDRPDKLSSYLRYIQLIIDLQSQIVTRRS